MVIPKLSVILPVYNSEKYVYKAIESVLKQTFTNFELLVINDGSTDKSAQIIASFKDDRISIINNETNIGLTKTLNKGLDKARGKYIARMDADDICLPTRFEKQIEYLDNNPDIDVLGTAFEIFGNENQTVYPPINSIEINLELYFNNIMCHPSIMLRKNSINDLKYDDKYLHNEDWAFWLKCIQNGLKFSNLNTVLLKYRVQGQNISQQHKHTAFKRTTLIYKNFLPYVFNTITDEQLELHYQLSKGVIDINQLKIKKIKSYFNKLEYALKQTYFNVDIVKKIINKYKLHLFYKIADQNKALAFKYALNLNIVGGKTLRYLI
ncbi:MAG TPA: glycosyltransferase [Crocinitomix sp.]|nr:glycosyltransferase [Crocinitomix sp.]